MQSIAWQSRGNSDLLADSRFDLLQADLGVRNAFPVSQSALIEMYFRVHVMNVQWSSPAESLWRSILLFFPTVVSLVFSLLTFVVGVALELMGFSRISSFILRVSGYVFSVVFLPLSQQSGLFKNFQGRQRTPVP